MQIHRQLHPSQKELEEFFERAFANNVTGDLSEESDQSFNEWFSVKEMINYLPNGVLLEARDDDHLVGAVFVGKQNPLSWPDGQKAEVFIIGVEATFRNKGLGKELMAQAELAAKEMGARTIIIHTHTDLKTLHGFYRRLGYEVMGTLNNYYDNGSAIFFKKNMKPNMIFAQMLQKAVIIDAADNVLVLKRADDYLGSRAGKWDLPGGNLDLKDLDFN